MIFQLFVNHWIRSLCFNLPLGEILHALGNLPRPADELGGGKRARQARDAGAFQIHCVALRIHVDLWKVELEKKISKFLQNSE